MKVTVKNLTTGARFEADVVNGSVADGKVDLGNGSQFVGSGSCEYWLDTYGNQGFRYEITEVEDSPKVNPTALMEIIGNIPAGEWSKISGMANGDINKQNTGPNCGLHPVTRAQVIRCLYAFERYARENGLIETSYPLPEPEIETREGAQF